MTGATEDKIHDKLMEYSKPVTGSYWFAPSLEDLKEILK
jgi:putative iron-dependent peroxidase